MAAWTADDRELMRADKVLRRVMEEQGPIHPDIDRRGSRPDPWQALARAIVGQQLSTRAAASIWNKLLAIFGGRMPTPEQFLRRRRETLRKAGLSNAKVEYLRDLAARIKDGRLDLAHLKDLSDEDVCAELVEVKGIGRWSAEMFLIFHLGRKDIVSAAISGSGARSRWRMGWTSCRGPTKSIELQSLGGHTGRSPVSTCGGPWTTLRHSG